jgi:hypothetical protein
VARKDFEAIKSNQIKSNQITSNQITSNLENQIIRGTLAPVQAHSTHTSRRPFSSRSHLLPRSSKMGDEEEEIAPRIIEEEAKNVMVDVGPLEDFLCAVAPTLLDADPKEFRQAVLQVVAATLCPVEFALRVKMRPWSTAPSNLWYVDLIRSDRRPTIGCNSPSSPRTVNARSFSSRSLPGPREPPGPPSSFHSR